MNLSQSSPFFLSEKIDRLFKEFFPKTEVVSLECGHLRGLKDRGPEYEKALKGFLAR
jgi:hypothetical protein